MKNTSTKIQLVVLDNHTLGLINPGSDHVDVLHSSILKGAPFELFPSGKLISMYKTKRLASEKDFDEFRVSFEWYKKHPEEYEFKK